MSCSHPKHGPSARHDIQGRNLAGERYWIPHARVQHAGPELDSFSDRHCRSERNERGGPGARMVAHVETVERGALVPTANANHDARSLGLACTDTHNDTRQLQHA